MSKVIEALRREHRSIETVLDVLDSEIAYLAEFAGRRRADYRIVWSAIDYFMDYPDLIHHPKEDLIFEQLREIDPAAAHGVGDIPASHTALAGDLYALSSELKAVMDNPRRPRETLVSLARTFVRHQRRHFEMEEALFFPVVERAFDAKARAALELRLLARLGPLIDGDACERFDALRRDIVAAAGQNPPAAP